jgi:hypothetical protein
VAAWWFELLVCKCDVIPVFSLDSEHYLLKIKDKYFCFGLRQKMSGDSVSSRGLLILMGKYLMNGGDCLAVFPGFRVCNV